MIPNCEIELKKSQKVEFGLIDESAELKKELRELETELEEGSFEVNGDPLEYEIERKIKIKKNRLRTIAKVRLPEARAYTRQFKSWNNSKKLEAKYKEFEKEMSEIQREKRILLARQKAIGNRENYLTRLGLPRPPNISVNIRSLPATFTIPGAWKSISSFEEMACKEDPYLCNCKREIDDSLKTYKDLREALSTKFSATKPLIPVKKHTAMNNRIPQELKSKSSVRH